ncbi:MAG: hypothetical protein ACLR56_11580 [Oscillospiraceae bacterium]
MGIVSVPDFTFLEAAKGFGKIDGQYIATVAVHMYRLPSLYSQSTLPTIRISPP